MVLVRQDVLIFRDIHDGFNAQTMILKNSQGMYENVVEFVNRKKLVRRAVRQVVYSNVIGLDLTV